MVCSIMWTFYPYCSKNILSEIGMEAWLASISLPITLDQMPFNWGGYLSNNQICKKYSHMLHHFIGTLLTQQLGTLRILLCMASLYTK